MSTPRVDRWYERYAWVVFVVITLFGIVGALVVLVNPASATGLFERFGYPLPSAIASDRIATEYVEFVSHWSATGTLGFDLFGLLIAVTAFRGGERWAWLAFWYWPAMFLMHFATYQSSFRYAQLVWVAISVATLLAARRKAWAAPSRPAPPPAVST